MKRLLVWAGGFVLRLVCRIEGHGWFVDQPDGSLICSDCFEQIERSA